MPRKKKVKKTQDEVVREWFSWVNSWNAEELKISFELYLDQNGYKIEEKR